MYFFFFTSSNSLNITLNSPFLYDLKHNVYLSKIVCGTLHFRFCFAFIGAFIFVQQKAWTRLFWNIGTFKIKIIEQPHAVLSPDVWFLSCEKKFKNSMGSTWLGGPQKLWPGDELFKLSETKFWVCQFFSKNFIINIKYLTFLTLLTYLVL